MDQPTLVGVVQAIGQARANPANGLHVGGAVQKAQCRPGRGGQRDGLALGDLEQFDDVAAGALLQAAVFQVFEHVGPTVAAEERHAQGAQVLGRKILHQVQRHDVRVLQAGQRQVLVAAARGELDDQRPIGQRRLRGQENPADRASAQLSEQLKFAQRLAGSRIGGGPGVRLEQSVAIEQRGEFVLPLRKAGEDFARGDHLAQLLAQADFLVDDPHGKLRIGRQQRMTLEPGLGRRTLATVPGGRHRGQGLGFQLPQRGIGRVGPMLHGDR